MCAFYTLSFSVSTLFNVYDLFLFDATFSPTLNRPYERSLSNTPVFLVATPISFFSAFIFLFSIVKVLIP